MVVVAKKKIREQAQVFGDAYGCTVLLNIEKGQKWNATCSSAYWILSRRGNPIKLRFTKKAFNEIFESEEAKDD